MVDAGDLDASRWSHRHGKRHTKSEIIQSVWNPHFRGPDNIVEVYVRYVRRKIDIPFGTNTVETIRGVGYRVLP